jgi:uncharacterized hydrophobic protein (TIGR00271 family)
MAILHLRVICPQSMTGTVIDLLSDRPGVVAVAGPGESSDGAVISADLARETADAVLHDLHTCGVTDHGMLVLEPVDVAVGHVADRAERDAPGEAADALIWDELVERTGSDSTFTWTFLAFIVLATILAAIGVVEDSQIALVGAMVVGPDFGPLAGLAVGLVRRRGSIARQASVALLIGFPVAILVTAGLSLAAHAGGLISEHLFAGPRATAFIYHPGWLSLITALVAGVAGMLSLTSSQSAVLVGVFISVTTIPAAGNISVAAALGEWSEAGKSLAQLAINIVGITAAATATLYVRGAAEPRLRARDA